MPIVPWLVVLAALVLVLIQGCASSSMQMPGGPQENNRLLSTVSAGGVLVAVYSRAGTLRFDPNRNQWRPLRLPKGSQPPLAKRAPQDLLFEPRAIGDRILFFDGRQGALYHPATDSWRTFKTPLWTDGWTTRILEDASAILMHPRDPSGNAAYSFADAALFDLATWRWLRLPVADAPSPRMDPVVVWTGQALIVWGGHVYHQGYHNHAVPVAGGARFSPDDPRWQPLPTAQAPSARLSPAWAWTGTTLLVRGGRQLNPPEKALDGARYDPARDQWEPMAAGGPEFGGENARFLGGRWLFLSNIIQGSHIYDPEQDRWHQVSDPGFHPHQVTRFLPTRDGRMLAIVQLNERRPPIRKGALLDPRTNTWHTVDVSKFPAYERYAQQAWTGDVYLAWYEAKITMLVDCTDQQPGMPECMPAATGRILPKGVIWRLAEHLGRRTD